jgi:hypothetical protein
MQIFYRISEAGYNKVKPSYVHNESCLKNAVRSFPNANWTIIADNISAQTTTMLEQYIKQENIHHVKEGNGARTFNIALDKALGYSEDEIIYFLENDYLHKPNAETILEEGFNLEPSFVSLYDHPDKYMLPAEGGNPYCDGGAEDTRVYLTKSIHWKITNATTMTFAARVSTLKRTEPILRKWTAGNHPHDFEMFLDLRSNGELLITPLPGYSTHGESAWLTPLTNWEEHA